MEKSKKLKKLPLTAWLVGIMFFYIIISGILWVLTLFWDILFSSINLLELSIYMNSGNIFLGKYSIFVGTIIFLLIFPITAIVDLVLSSFAHKASPSKKRAINKIKQ